MKYSSVHYNVHAYLILMGRSTPLFARLWEIYRCTNASDVHNMQMYGNSLKLIPRYLNSHGPLYRGNCNIQ